MHVQGMPMHRATDPAHCPRNRSVRAAGVGARLRTQHTQGLSRSPQTVPINTEAADQTCWSAPCAYARRREKRPYLVAGVTGEGPTDELRAVRSLTKCPLDHVGHEGGRFVASSLGDFEWSG
jgi:hypothetical protein